MRDIMLIIHLFSVALLLGSGISALVINRVSKIMLTADAKKLKTATLSLNYVAKTGITLLIITGGYLMTPYWKMLGELPVLMVKLALVIILLALLVITSIKGKNAKKSQSEDDFKITNRLYVINSVLSIAIIILAVMVFH